MVRRPPSSTLFPDPTLFRYPMVAPTPAREAAIPKPVAFPSFVPAASPKSVPPRPTPRPPGTPAYVRPRAAPFGTAGDGKDAPPPIAAPAPSDKAAPASSDKAAPAPSDKAAPAASAQAASVQRPTNDTA